MQSKSIYIHAQNIGDESKTQDDMNLETKKNKGMVWSNSLDLIFKL